MYQKLIHKKTPGEQFFAHLILRCLQKNEVQISHDAGYRGERNNIFSLKNFDFFLGRREFNGRPVESPNWTVTYNCGYRMLLRLITSAWGLFSGTFVSFHHLKDAKIEAHDNETSANTFISNLKLRLSIVMERFYSKVNQTVHNRNLLRSNIATEERWK